MSWSPQSASSSAPRLRGWTQVRWPPLRSTGNKLWIEKHHLWHQFHSCAYEIQGDWNARSVTDFKLIYLHQLLEEACIHSETYVLVSEDYRVPASDASQSPDFSTRFSSCCKFGCLCEACNCGGSVYFPRSVLLTAHTAHWLRPARTQHPQVGQRRLRRQDELRFWFRLYTFMQVA